MEHSQFDRLARAVGAPHTRRTAATLLGALVAAPLAGHRPVAAKKKKKVKLPGGSPAADVQFRHHAVTTPAEPTPKAPE